MDVPALTIIAASGLSVLGLAIRCLFRFLDHRDERRLLLAILDKTGSADDYGRYIELRTAGRAVMLNCKATSGDPSCPQATAACPLTGHHTPPAAAAQRAVPQPPPQ